MKIESITTTQREDGGNLVIIWYKDKKRGITKGGLSFKSFKDKATAEAWLSGESIYNKRQADSMLAKIEEISKPEKIENLQPANNTGALIDKLKQYPAEKLPPVGLYFQLVTATELRNGWNCGEWLKYLEA